MPVRRDLTPVALIAFVAIAAGLIAALATRDSATGPRAGSAARENAFTERTPKPKRTDPAVLVARRYALAARNWSPATYTASWRRQVRLSGASYRDELASAKPGPGELRALREDRARSSGRVLQVERTRPVGGATAKVLVLLAEVTRAGSQLIEGRTLNEVRLRRRAGRWWVVGWTVIPGAETVLSP